jgi:ATP-dependent Clp protease ATP-binding subunit ClpC
MGKVNVYLPDDLEREVREAGLAVSPICQVALRETLDRLAALRSRHVGVEQLAAHTGRGRFTPRLTAILADAEDDAAERGRQVTPYDLLGAILHHGENLGAETLAAAGVELPPAGFRGRGGRNVVKGSGELSPESRAVLAAAYLVAVDLRHEHLGAEHVVIALAGDDSPLHDLFAALGLDARLLRGHVERLLLQRVRAALDA